MIAQKLSNFFNLYKITFCKTFFSNTSILLLHEIHVNSNTYINPILKIKSVNHHIKFSQLNHIFFFKCTQIVDLAYWLHPNYRTIGLATLL